jgi:hypothetical protein
MYVKYTDSATANLWSAARPGCRVDAQTRSRKGIRYGKAAHGRVSRVLIRAGREIEEAGRQQVCVGGGVRQQVLGVGSRCRLGETAH